MIFEGFSIVNALLLLAALAVGWTLLKVVLRLTMRLFTCGCLAILALVGLIWLVITVLR
jgi:hypothetical protein